MQRKISIMTAFILGSTVLSVAHATDKTVADKALASPDNRKGIPLSDLIKPTDKTRYIEQQTTGDKQIYSELFKPTLTQWVKAKGELPVERNKLIYESDYRVDKPTKIIGGLQDLIELQYFYKQSLHAQMLGENANSILKFTHSKNGKVFVSTRFNKVYDLKPFYSETDKKTEYSQCVDISARITVTKVPIRDNFGRESLVDYWQDFEVPVCHTDSNES
ncbi:hypothetical protein HLH17_02135 [Acinetobacter sp. ANC 5380]|uniref:Uncharacterized protein n=1 Tax=Acinetobacter terrae TaxID=2731247 RepID=A0A7Y2RCX6_9GAMM|nr:hypothetical protein [Acinetobacter terrae]NNH76501.1 hypothetical protein [Acinetobacter terrae]